MHRAWPGRAPNMGIRSKALPRLTPALRALEDSEGIAMTTYRDTPHPPARRPTPVVDPRPVRGDADEAPRDLSAPRSWATRIPWTALVDTFGLLAGLALVTWRIGLEDATARLFLAALTASSLYVWLLFTQMRSLGTILRRRRFALYLVPTFAVGSAAAVLVVGGVSLPWLEAAAFVGLWTTVMVAGRALLARNQAPLRVLLIGSPPFRRELEGRSDVEVVSLNVPPDRVNGWDVVATDPAEQYDREWLQWISHADMHDVKVISAPLLLETLTGRVPTEMLHGRWAFEVLDVRSRYRFWKRLFDLTAVVVFSPLLLLISAAVAALVAIDSGRPVLFVQKRVGLGGRPFRMFKFRTMVADAEANGSAFATHDDPRITRIGALLRQYRLDEIPQFWNVLRGEMSIIGPRPEQLAFADEFDEAIALYRLRHAVRPGITGWAQVRQGYAADTLETEKKLRYDFYYVKHCSIGLDATIVWRTILTVATGFGSR